MIRQFKPIETPRPWGKEILVAKTDRYTGKVLIRTHDGTRAGLQYHPTRDETFHVWTGRAIVYADRGDGVIERRELKPGDSVYVPAGTAHSVETIGVSIMFEASHPIADGEIMSVPVEAQYRAQMRAFGASRSVQDEEAVDA